MPPNPASDQGHPPQPGPSEGPRSCFAIDVPAGLLARARSGERAAFEQISDKGVLVLTSSELNGLQNGDVIQSVDGRLVDSPREVMDALRDKPANARVAVGYMRDRKNRQSQSSPCPRSPCRLSRPRRPGHRRHQGARTARASGTTGGCAHPRSAGTARAPCLRCASNELRHDRLARNLHVEKRKRSGVMS